MFLESTGLISAAGSSSARTPRLARARLGLSRASGSELREISERGRRGSGGPPPRRWAGRWAAGREAGALGPVPAEVDAAAQEGGGSQDRRRCAVVAKAADKGCFAICRQLLQAQVNTAAVEVAAARAEIEAKRAVPEDKLKQAQAALAMLPLPPSATPLADRLGITGWTLELSQAWLASLAATASPAF